MGRPFRCFANDGRLPTAEVDEERQLRAEAVSREALRQRRRAWESGAKAEREAAKARAVRRAPPLYTHIPCCKPRHSYTDCVLQGGVCVYNGRRSRKRSELPEKRLISRLGRRSLCLSGCPRSSR